MSLLEVTDQWVIPFLAFLADWSIRWGVLLAMLWVVVVIRPPRAPGCATSCISGL